LKATGKGTSRMQPLPSKTVSRNRRAPARQAPTRFTVDDFSRVFGKNKQRQALSKCKFCHAERPNHIGSECPKRPPYEKCKYCGDETPDHPGSKCPRKRIVSNASNQIQPAISNVITSETSFARTKSGRAAIAAQKASVVSMTGPAAQLLKNPLKLTPAHDQGAFDAHQRPIPVRRLVAPAFPNASTLDKWRADPDGKKNDAEFWNMVYQSLIRAAICAHAHGNGPNYFETSGTMKSNEDLPRVIAIAQLVQDLKDAGYAITTNEGGMVRVTFSGTGETRAT
jgi:hypothetical protein